MKEARPDPSGSEEQSNRIPDHGWNALANVSGPTFTPIPNKGLDPAADQDLNPQDPPAEIVVTKSGHSKNVGLAGDGLSTLQEYRGFVVNGEHRRLNPFHKDLFLYIAPTLSAGARDVFLQLAGTLKVTRHLVREPDVLAAPDGTAPVVNFNGLGVPGASSPQRGVFLRPRQDRGHTFDFRSSRKYLLRKRLRDSALGLLPRSCGRPELFGIGRGFNETWNRTSKM